MTPVTRKETYLAALGGDDVTIPEPVTREEVYLAAAVNHGDEKIVEETDAWLDENVAQETGYVLDRTLQMENAAAPADLVGSIGTDVETLQTDVETAEDDIDALETAVGTIGDAITSAQIDALFS